MNELLQILGVASIGTLIQNFEFYQTALKKLYIDFKPFNCTLCFTTWLALGHFLYLDGVSIEDVYFAAIAGILAELIDRKLNDY